MKKIVIAILFCVLAVNGFAVTFTSSTPDVWQTVSAGTMNAGNIVDISDSAATYVVIRYTGEAGQNLTGGELQFMIMLAATDAGPWFIHQNYPAVELITDSDTISGTEDPGQLTLTLTDAAADGFDTVGLTWFILDSTMANSEVVQTISASVNDVTIVDGTLNAHTDSVVINEVHEIILSVPTGFAKVKVLALNEDPTCDAYYTVIIHETAL